MSELNCFPSKNRRLLVKYLVCVIQDGFHIKKNPQQISDEMKKSVARFQNSLNGETQTKIHCWGSLSQAFCEKHPTQISHTISMSKKHSLKKHSILAVLLVTFLGWLSDPFRWLSDLQLGDQKVTLNHLDVIFFPQKTFHVKKKTNKNSPFIR